MERVEQKLNLVIRNGGIPIPNSLKPVLSPEVKELAEKNEKIRAVALHRRDTGAGLAETCELIIRYHRKEDPLYLALRATANHGIEAAEELLGLRVSEASGNVEQQGHALAARLLGAANFAAKLGFHYQDLPVFRHAFRALKALRRNNIAAATRQSEAGIGAAIIGKSFERVLPQLIEARVDYPVQAVAKRMQTESVTSKRADFEKFERAA